MSKRLDFFHNYIIVRLMRKNYYDSIVMHLMKTERKAHVNFIVGKSLQKSIKLALQIFRYQT